MHVIISGVRRDGTSFRSEHDIESPLELGDRFTYFGRRVQIMSIEDSFGPTTSSVPEYVVAEVTTRLTIHRFLAGKPSSSRSPEVVRRSHS